MSGDCQCGDRGRLHINHRSTIPCYTFIGDRRYTVGADGEIDRFAAPPDTQEDE